MAKPSRAKTERGLVTMRNLFQRRRKLAENNHRVAHLVSLQRKDVRGLEDQDFRQAGRIWEVPPANIRAFYKVESDGAGFGPQGRLTILYEPHQVHRATGGALTGMTVPWQWNGYEIDIPLSYRRWKPLTPEIRRDSSVWHPYKEDQEGRWQMLATAYRYHPEALQGASYGAFQVLGKWAKNLGYDDALHMIETMCEGEREHLAGAMRYIKMVNGVGALKNGDWRTLARLYNGTGQVDYYAGRLQVAHAESVQLLDRGFA